MIKQHAKGQQDGRRVALVLPGDIGSGAPGRIEHGDIDPVVVRKTVIAARTGADAADQAACHVRQEVAVFIQHQDNLVILGMQDDLRQQGIEQFHIVRYVRVIPVHFAGDGLEQSVRRALDRVFRGGSHFQPLFPGEFKGKTCGLPAGIALDDAYGYGGVPADHPSGVIVSSARGDPHDIQKHLLREMGLDALDRYHGPQDDAEIAHAAYDGVRTGGSGNGGIFQRKPGFAHRLHYPLEQSAILALAVFKREIVGNKIEVQGQYVRHRVNGFAQLGPNPVPEQFSNVNLFHFCDTPVVKKRSTGLHTSSPRYIQPEVQVSPTTTEDNRGKPGLIRFQIQRARFSLVGFSSPSISFR